jgi:hypothetical protein
VIVANIANGANLKHAAYTIRRTPQTNHRTRRVVMTPQTATQMQVAVRMMEERGRRIVIATEGGENDMIMETINMTTQVMAVRKAQEGVKSK